MIFKNLPSEIIEYILSFNYHFVFRNNKLICINFISKEDFRYKLIMNIQKKYEITKNSWSVILSLNENKRYVLGYRLYANDNWEYFFAIFNRDRITSFMENNTEDNKIFKLK
jgi:hypothetical protein